MVSLSDIRSVRSAVARLTSELDGALTDPRGLGTRRAAELAAELDNLHREIEYARDSGIELARRIGASWSLLEELTGTADSTLHARLRRHRRARSERE